jgi:hypothetical protein
MKLELTAGQQLTRGALILFATTAIVMGFSADRMMPDVRVFTLGLALAFLHVASNKPALIDNRLSFNKSGMQLLPKVLLVLSELCITVAMGYSVVSMLSFH